MKRKEFLRNMALAGGAVAVQPPIGRDERTAWAKMLAAMDGMAERGWEWNVRAGTQWEGAEIVVTFPAATGLCPANCGVLQASGRRADLPRLFVALYERRMGPMKE